TEFTCENGVEVCAVSRQCQLEEPQTLRCATEAVRVEEDAGHVDGAVTSQFDGQALARCGHPAGGRRHQPIDDALCPETSPAAPRWSSEATAQAGAGDVESAQQSVRHRPQ